MVTICHCTSKHHRLPYFKCVLRCCDKFPSNVLPSQEENKYTTKMCPKIQFHVYRNVSCCTMHARHPYHKKNNMFIVFHSYDLWKDGQIIHTKRTCVTRNINNIISWKVLRSINRRLGQVQEPGDLGRVRVWATSEASPTDILGEFDDGSKGRGLLWDRF